MNLVSSTNSLLRKLKETGFEGLLDKVKSFCQVRNIDIPDFSKKYVKKMPSRHLKKFLLPDITVEHHYRMDIFEKAIDSQLQELSNKFSANVMELLLLSVSLEPKDQFSSFDMVKICKLASEFYPEDFSDEDRAHLKVELSHYINDVPLRPEFSKLTSLRDLCQMLKKSGKSTYYPLVDKLIRLVLTLPVSTATTERAFSAMANVKTKLRNKMEDDYLAPYLMVNIEKEIAQTISIDSTIKEFASLKERRSQFF